MFQGDVAGIFKAQTHLFVYETDSLTKMLLQRVFYLVSPTASNTSASNPTKTLSIT